MNSTWVSAIASISASSLNSWHGVKRVRHSHSVQRARGEVIPTKRRYTRRGRAILPYGVSWDLGCTGVTENQFFERPILNSPYDYPSQHWEGREAHGGGGKGAHAGDERRDHGDRGA